VPRFVPAIEPPDEPSPDARVYAFRDGELVLTATRTIPSLGDLTLPVVRRQFLGRLDGVESYSAEIDPAAALGERLVSEPLRTAFGHLDEEVWILAGRASQIVAWERDHAHCGRCGRPTSHLPRERARHCDVCGLSAYPRIAPAVIVLVQRGRDALLCRGAAFPRPWYSTLAGFVEPGETLEQAVAREVAEEAGITIRDIHYFASQPWPFPNSLMVGFTAGYAGGELRLDPAELADGGWYPPDALPDVPPLPSIARRLINDWLVRTTSVRPTP
jgi:NAD+ diphosphatase